MAGLDIASPDDYAMPRGAHGASPTPLGDEPPHNYNQMAFDLRQTTRAYIEAIPGSFVSFLYIQADILDTIANEWKAVGKFKWYNVLGASALKIRSIAEELSIISSEHDKETEETTK